MPAFIALLLLAIWTLFRRNHVILFDLGYLASMTA